MNPVIEKIRKLQALADRAGSEAEAVNAAERIRELLYKHNLDIGCIALKAESGTNAEADAVFSRVGGHHWDLGEACNELFDVKCYLYTSRQEYRSAECRFHFLGLSANVEAACLTFCYLCESVESLLAGWKLGCDTEFWDRPAQYRSFRLGASRRILEMARENKRQSIECNPSSVELVRVGNDVAERMYSTFKFKKSFCSSVASDRSAFADGHREGGRVDIHGARKSRMLNGNNAGSSR